MAKTSALALLAALCACGDPTSERPLPAAPGTCSERPPATRRDELVEELHGTPVADPYRWLEDASDPAVQGWMRAQDDHARGLLAALPEGPALRARLAELLYVDAISAPVRRGDRIFYTRRHKDREKAIYYVRDGEDGDERVLLDPNTLSPDGSISVHGVFPSYDGRLLAYKLSINNADASTMHLRDLDSGRELPDRIDNARYASPAWTPDGRGFYYVWLPADPSIPPAELPGRAEVRFHRVGDAGDHDDIIAAATGDASRFVGVQLSRDGRFLTISHQHGWNSTDLYFKDLSEAPASDPPVPKDIPAPGFRPLVAGRPAIFDLIAWRGAFYVHTNDGAPRYRVFKVDPARPERAHWRELVPESDATLEGVQVIGDRLVLSYLRDAHNELQLRDLEGAPIGPIALPGLGSTSGLVGEPDDPRAYFHFTSFTQPDQIYSTDVQRGETHLWRAIEVPVDTSRFTVEQVRYPSKDGTPISMFIVRRRDLPLDGKRPTLLYGYGGFSVSLTPAFSARAVAWLEHGGVYAVPNLRGGGEYGEDWHRAGMREQKQNAFDDFAAAAQYLITHDYTRPQQLAVYGGSNGGLLVGALMTQHPELVRAVVCAVPLLDMLRYHRFGAGRTWIPEYGDPDIAAEFAWLHPYSPYHHVPKDSPLPALLMLSADSDDRVDPMHARKFTAAVQHVSERPAWLRVERNAGHGGADLVQQTIAREADALAFLLAELGA
ncbi:MAG: S9 family peptidase [Nannocystis sp.]|uniref:prolyl oligopeptidase family serine peptidase n=1 Tax=Nannocystis sp. TaxID=1962667 RepID=UPI00242772CD|nr:prolyl oligopeptidase family serine peptidase [Nannocystis sp.]MBK9753559.1 S9 family peptidase [Nannocystis sp.]